jgi:hypothetical protein
VKHDKPDTDKQAGAMEHFNLETELGDAEITKLQFLRRGKANVSPALPLMG